VPGSPAQVGDGRAHRGLGQHAQAERQCRRRDVVAPLDLDARRDRGEIGLAELPVQCFAGACAQGRK
jgi:hypothetical protein